MSTNNSLVCVARDSGQLTSEKLLNHGPAQADVGTGLDFLSHAEKRIVEAGSYKKELDLLLGRAILYPAWTDYSNLAYSIPSWDFSNKSDSVIALANVYFVGRSISGSEEAVLQGNLERLFPELSSTANRS
jgi:hypothetical protein